MLDGKFQNDSSLNKKRIRSFIVFCYERSSEDTFRNSRNCSRATVIRYHRFMFEQRPFDRHKTHTLTILIPRTAKKQNLISVEVSTYGNISTSVCCHHCEIVNKFVQFNFFSPSEQRMFRFHIGGYNYVLKNNSKIYPKKLVSAPVTFLM